MSSEASVPSSRRPFRPWDGGTCLRVLAPASGGLRGMRRLIGRGSHGVRLFPTHLDIAEARVRDAVPQGHRSAGSPSQSIREQGRGLGKGSPATPDGCRRRPCAHPPRKHPRKRGSKPKKALFSASQFMRNRGLPWSDPEWPEWALDESGHDQSWVLSTMNARTLVRDRNGPLIPPPMGVTTSSQVVFRIGSAAGVQCEMHPRVRSRR